MFKDVTGIDPQVGPTVQWRDDNQWYQWCWTGLTNNQDYYFFTGYYSWGNGAWARHQLG